MASVSCVPMLTVFRIDTLILLTAGHLTYGCRNFIRMDPTKDVHLDVSSTSSEESEEDKISISSTSTPNSSSEEERRKRRQQESMFQDKLIVEILVNFSVASAD